MHNSENCTRLRATRSRLTQQVDKAATQKVYITMQTSRHLLYGRGEDVTDKSRRVRERGDIEREKGK